MTSRFPRTLLIQFAKAPELHRVKSRMRSRLTAEQCVLLHKRLVEDIYQRLTKDRLASVELWKTGRDETGFFAALTPPPVIREQVGSNLGARMYAAFKDALQRYSSVVLVGSDCPSLNRSILLQVISSLADGVDCVLVPATDGGYVLMGLSRLDESLFADINWGTNRVYMQTLSRLQAMSWRWTTLTPLPDIDTPRDLEQISGLKHYEDLFLSC